MGKQIVNIAALAADLLPPHIKKVFYHLGPITRFIRRMLNRELPLGISEQVIAGGPLKNYKFYLDMQSEKDYWLGTYETSLLESVVKLIQPGWVVYDVGANVGYLTVLFAKLVGKEGQVHAFEPLPDNIKRLMKNVEINNLNRQVHIYPYAVGDRCATVSFYIGNSDDTGKVENVLSEGEKGKHERIDVDMITLDEFISRNTSCYPQLIKMDIEGAEILAFDGMENILGRIKPIIIIEIHSRDAGRKVWEALNRYNYEIKKLNGQGEVLTSSEKITRRDYIIGIPK